MVDQLAVDQAHPQLLLARLLGQGEGEAQAAPVAAAGGAVDVGTDDQGEVGEQPSAVVRGDQQGVLDRLPGRGLDHVQRHHRSRRQVIDGRGRLQRPGHHQQRAVGRRLDAPEGRQLDGLVRKPRHARLGGPGA